MGLRILITNDHVYWDQDYIEKLFYALREAGHNVVVSAPNYILPVLGTFCLLNKFLSLPGLLAWEV